MNATATQPVNTNPVVYKVLPFTTEEGECGGHEIRALRPAWTKGEHAVSVVFETYDREVEMAIEVVVHVSRWTKYVHRQRNGARVVAVIMSDGRRLPAAALYANYPTHERREAAPIFARGNISIVTLCSRETLVDIVGVREYLFSRKPIECPWERDNRKFREHLISMGCDPDRPLTFG